MIIFIVYARWGPSIILNEDISMSDWWGGKREFAFNWMILKVFSRDEETPQSPRS